MGKYCKEVKELSVEITRAITEALGLGATYLDSKTEQGMQVVAVNCYPPCPNPETALGLPPHSDYSCLTILLQSSPGLEILDPRDGSWKPVPAIPGALQVHIGDHFQALSNGIFKSIVHRVTLNNSTTRISVASLHSLGLDDKVGPAPELVAQKKKYKESSVKDFLDFLNRNDLSKGGTFMDTLKLED